jgi:hypothetical protein
VTNNTGPDFDMNIVFKPDGSTRPRNTGMCLGRWLRNDMQNMAFFYTHKLFAKLVKEGGLE